MIEVQRVQGKVIVKYQGHDTTYPSSIDALLGHVMLVCGIRFQYRLCDVLAIHRAGVCRIRKGLATIPEPWYLRLHEYSGVPVADLRLLSNEVNSYARL